MGEVEKTPPDALSPPVFEVEVGGATYWVRAGDEGHALRLARDADGWLEEPEEFQEAGALEVGRERLAGCEFYPPDWPFEDPAKSVSMLEEAERDASCRVIACTEWV